MRGRNEFARVPNNRDQGQYDFHFTGPFCLIRSALSMQK